MTEVLTISKRLCYIRPPNRRLQEYAVMGEKDDTLLNSRQVAELLDLSPDTINELARKHSLPGAEVLEVGVGTGLSLAAYPTHCEVTGIHLAPEMLERAKQKAVENGWRHFRLLQMDALNLDFPDNAFDYVTSFHVISVVPDPVRMMQEIHRVCKPGGTVVIINHFRTTKPVLGPLIGALDPLTRRLGWSASLRLSEAFDGVPVRIEKRFKTSPFSLFTVVLAQNQKLA